MHSVLNQNELLYDEPRFEQESQNTVNDSVPLSYKCFETYVYILSCTNTSLISFGYTNGKIMFETSLW